jgi:PilZ domain
LFINAELSQLPTGEGRQSARRIVNIAAALREDGARNLQVIVLDVSLGGFKAESPEPLEEGAEVWLKLPGCEARRSRVVWAKEKDVGCEFEQPLHQGELDLIVAPTPRRVLRGVFGPAGTGKR